MARKPSDEILADLQASNDGLYCRDVGLWTLEKLATLQLYCRGFADACQKANGGYYVDGLAGPGLCEIRDAKMEPRFVWGSPLIALRTEPQIQRCIFMELGKKEFLALEQRTKSFGDRALTLRGDANKELARLMREEVPTKAPCFCLLDPEATELAWQTVFSVASTPGRQRKPELLILFPLQMSVLRLLSISDPITAENREKVASVFRGNEWEAIYNARVTGRLSAAAAKDQYLQTYTDDVRSLGYESVLSKMITAPAEPGKKRQERYHLVFATDHHAGDEIMRYVFGRPYVLDFPVSQQPPLFEA